MKCPNCNEILLMTERHQIEIDYCPNCRGVWLDKGELDKLMEYASSQTISREDRPEQNRPSRGYDNSDSSHMKNYQENYRDDRYYDQRDDRDYRNHNQKYPRKKKSFLSDLFDFD
ncbi:MULTISPECIES: zf-TFIIB domain-containing protein [Sphingobacterium]|uniref:TFIIB-type zinc ribbon-containing protein n=1 Tax=Sphingobacterium TaxID=28453 RepID=UPI000C0BD2E0|nr:MULTISPECIES: zf-TFIIB domain-containing protein [Sphingobacterium]MCT1530458.1 zf-TFIIB domain-containing protein [Sphingobacterium daejeonense]